MLQSKRTFSTPQMLELAPHRSSLQLLKELEYDLRLRMSNSMAPTTLLYGPAATLLEVIDPQRLCVPYAVAVVMSDYYLKELSQQKRINQQGNIISYLKHSSCLRPQILVRHDNINSDIATNKIYLRGLNHT